MTKTLFASAALLLVTVAPAFADEKPTVISFQRDGESYVYTKTEKAGIILLSGRLPAGAPFELTVRGNEVTGTIDGASVSFSMRRVRAKPDVTMASATR
jgi:hypothetical protein